MINYIVYKTTNCINGKFYVGKHITCDLDDGYLGSGTLLKRALKKYGIENFSREVLGSYNSKKEMDLAEKILVVLDKEVSYNICPGGHGGFGYVNSIRTSEQSIINGRKGIIKTDVVMTAKYGKNWRSKMLSKDQKEEAGRRRSQTSKERGVGFFDPIVMEKAREAARSETAISKRKNTYKSTLHQQGEKNNMFGKIWITNEIDSKRILENELIPDGWRKGRVMRPKYPVLG